MKKRKNYYIYLVLLLTTLAGCRLTPDKQENVSLEIWHYYNGAQQIVFDEFVDEFNETIGLEKGIVVEAYSQGNIDQLEDKMTNSVEEKVGASDLPDMVTAYSETAYNLDQRGILTNLDDYLSAEDLDEYLDTYIKEGRLGGKDEFKIFPTAKATEVLMLNKTDWDEFAEATGANKENLATWEGVHETAKQYYEWTDSLTAAENDGKAFFGRDALANYILVGSQQLGADIFQVQDGEVQVQLEPANIKRIWANYYIPYISGYYTSYGKFSSDDAKTGRIIALVGSTSGAVYFPEDVTVDDNDRYPIDLEVLPVPNFKDAGMNAVQQGAGIVVLESDETHEQASVEFLKWFTETNRNTEFAVQTGYLPVKKEAYDLEPFQATEDLQLTKQLETTIPVAMQQMEEYNLYYSQAFTKGFQARKFLEAELEEKAKADREKVLERLEQGETLEEVVEDFTSDEKFEEWFAEFEVNLLQVVADEK